jgi:hypothetical protein
MAKKKAPSFPVPDDLFSDAFQGLMAHLSVSDPESNDTVNPSWQRLGLDNVTVYTPLVKLLGSETTPNSWLYVFPLEKGKATFTPVLKVQKDDLKKKTLGIIRPERIILKELEKASPGFLTALDKKTWYIGEPNPLTSIDASLRTLDPVPSLRINSISYCLHVVDACFAETPSSKMFPDGIILMELARYIGAEAPTDYSQYTHLLFSGRFRNLSKFGAADRKKEAWYIARYISPTGWESRWSEAVSATIA